MLRALDWQRVTILNTDTVFAKDLANEFRRLWVGDYNGEVKHSDTIRINADGSANETSIQQVLKSVPRKDATSNSRIIFLSAHSQHAFPILQQAHESGFQPDTVWIGPSSWIGRHESPTNDFSWLPEHPGYLGVSVFRNRDDTFDTFMNHLNAYRLDRGRSALKELPPFAAETVDSIRAMTWALVNAPNRQDGKAVVETLRGVDFAGVSGRVQLTETGDRLNPQYSLFNAQQGPDSDGNIVWELWV